MANAFRSWTVRLALMLTGKLLRAGRYRLPNCCGASWRIARDAEKSRHRRFGLPIWTWVLRQMAESALLHVVMCAANNHTARRARRCHRIQIGRYGFDLPGIILSAAVFAYLSRETATLNLTAYIYAACRQAR